MTIIPVMNNHWDSEELFLEGDAYFRSLLEDIDNATSKITVEMYIFNHDKLGRKVLAHLIQAQSRGVQVQILVDGIGSLDFHYVLSEILEKSKVKFRFFNPIPFLHPLTEKIGLRGKIALIINRLLRMNQRNHRKIITIDHHIMYLGSFNITDEHTSHSYSLAWRDIGVRVTGEKVRIALIFFNKLWNLHGYSTRYFEKRKWPSEEIKSSPLRIKQTLLMRRFYNKDFLRRINHAKEEVLLTTPYFMPHIKLIKVLIRARKRGAKVKLLISEITDVGLFKYLKYIYFEELIKSGVEIYLYRKTVLHAKYFIIDDWMTLGSTNLNHRSLIHDLEVDIVLTNEENKLKLKKNFYEEIDDLVPLTDNDLRRRNFIERFLSKFFYVFKYWF